jgi:hypothetical protein
VTRHPVSCFASIVDYNRALLGPLMLSPQQLADWFCGDRMYWLPWPAHVAGWWDWSVSRPNVLFLHFEDMKADLGAIVDRVAAFLSVDLSDAERARVIDKSSFKYMQAHEDVFEMSPPTMFSVQGRRFMTSGRAGRDADVTPAIRDRILAFCRAGLAGRAYPAARFYPDLAGDQSEPAPGAAIP